MKKFLYLSILASFVSTSAIANNAGSIGKGYTGITSDFTNAALNPSLINNFKNNDDFYFSASEGIGFKGAELVSDISDSLDLLDEVDGGDKSDQTVDDFKYSLYKLNDKSATIENDFELLIAFPNKTLPFALFATQEAKINAHSSSGVDESTTNAELIQSVEDGKVDSDVSGIGYSVADAGIILGQTYVIHDQEINFGTSLKYQRIDIFKYKDSISDEPEIEDNLSDSSGFNIDLGMDTSFGDDKEYKVAFVAKNLIPKKLDAEDGTTFTLDPTITLGAGYYGSWYNVAVEADVLEHTGFKGFDKEQRIKVGGELDAWGHAKLRAGYMIDVNDGDYDRFTAGVRISPWDLFGLDLAGFIGKDENYGAALQVSLKL